MEIFHQIEDEVLIVKLKGESLDAKDSSDFKQKVTDLITKFNSKKVIIDLKNLKFIDSSGLGSFLAIMRFLNLKSGDLKLTNMSPTIRSMFELVAMHKIFDIIEDIPEAKRSFTAEARR